MTVRYGKCRECGYERAVKKDGRLRSHLSGDYESNGIFRIHCPGSDSEPAWLLPEGVKP
jgi:hypothetical protein